MSEIAKIISKQAQEQGVLPFAEFMRLALYCPKYGYYEQAPGQIGREGDFYTSVSTGSLFGELLGFQFAQWLASLSGKPCLVEAGAHSGRLALDVLKWLEQNRPALLNAMEYWIVEPSSRRRAWQRQTLENFAGQVRWCESLESLPPPGTRGVIFSNELLDALPVYRLGWDAAARRWFEWGVSVDCRLPIADCRFEGRAEEDGTIKPHTSAGESKSAIDNRQSAIPRFVWQRIPREPEYFARELNQAGLEFPPQLLAVLPDGYTIEVCPEAGAWWRQAASVLREGKLLTIDYGLTAEQSLAPERTSGTLRAYHHHHASSDVLARAGEQDLTAHVNWTQLQRAGEESGLRTEGLFSQERFFTNVAAKTWPNKSSFGAWTPARLRQFQTLTHPEHLGRPFSVLLQTRDPAGVGSEGGGVVE